MVRKDKVTKIQFLIFSLILVGLIGVILNYSILSRNTLVNIVSSIAILVSFILLSIEYLKSKKFNEAKDFGSSGTGI